MLLALQYTVRLGLLAKVQLQYHLTFTTKQRLPQSITFWHTYYRRKAIVKVHPITCHEGRGGKQS